MDGMEAPCASVNAPQNISSDLEQITFRETAVLGCSLQLDTQCYVSYWLYAVASPILILVGTVGNILTVIIMATKVMRRTAFGNYIAAIAIFDALTLWITLPRHFIRWVWLVDIRELNQWSCRFLRFFQFSLMNTSAWLLVTVTTERFLAVYFPTRGRLHTKTGLARCLIAIVSACNFGWNLHIFWTLGDETNESGCVIKHCGYPTEQAKYYWTQVHTWVDLTKLSILPFTVMLFMNVAIIVSLRRQSADLHNENIMPSLRDGCSIRRTPSDSALSKTPMLLSVSFFYLVSTLPTFVSTAFDNESSKTQVSSGSPLFTSVTTLVLYSNNAMNFILYSVSGATFRRLFRQTFKGASVSCSRRPFTRSRSDGSGNEICPVRTYCLDTESTEMTTASQSSREISWIPSDPSY